MKPFPSIKIRKWLCPAAILLFSLNAWSQQYPFQNPELSSEERARDLISRLTLEEKAKLMCDKSEAVPRLGIKQFNWWSEALHGYANNDSVTVFPEARLVLLRLYTCIFLYHSSFNPEVNCYYLIGI